MEKQLSSYPSAFNREDNGLGSWFRRNIRHIAMTLSISVIVYCFLYFVVLNNLVVMNARTEQFAVKTEYIQLKQDAMIKDMKKSGIKLHAVNNANSIIETSTTIK